MCFALYPLYLPQGFPVKKSPAIPPDQIEPDDAALFRAAVGEVKPLAEQNRITPIPSPRKPLLRPSIPPHALPDTLSGGRPAITSDLASVVCSLSRMAGSSIKSFSDSADGDAPDEFLSNGLSRLALRKLRRGNWPVQDRLDLHGLHSDAARKLMQEFLHEAMQRNLRCVLVIHGKGMNSPGGEAVLRKLARHWLTRHPGVMGYCDAPPREGGSGAVMILLKTGRGET
ncbi:MAG: hypothetical protein A2V79_01155 [Betaproteobacteria bacterium RBG_16_56_24]|nr:MAG: hypothetical protein A2V79_01155 [Betaproteobacteria bacterium RBG_16_56_24]